MVRHQEPSTHRVTLGPLATMITGLAVDNKKNKQKQQKKDTEAASVPPQATNNKLAPSTNMTEDPVVANLDVLSKLLFEGMTSRSVETVEDAAEHLANMLWNSSQMRMEAYEAGGHAVLMIAMKQWRCHEAIQASACQCIQNMCCTNALIKESFIAVGGIESVVTAMMTFPHSQRLQRSGCGALMNLLSPGSDDHHENDNKNESRHQRQYQQQQQQHKAFLETNLIKFVHEYDGTSLIIKAMKSFPDVLEIQLWGNGLFQSLARHKSCRMKMMQSGAVTAAGMSLELHYQDEKIKQYACSFLKTMFAE